MMNNVKWHLANLTRFSGREMRGVFWPYVGMVVLFQMVLSWLLTIPLLLVIFRNVQDFAQIQEDQIARSDPGGAALAAEQMQTSFLPLFGWILVLSAIMLVVILVLLAAATVRRLHDSGKSGFWGLLPLPFLVISNALMRWFFSGENSPDTGLIFLLFGSNMLYLIFLLLLIVLLAMPGNLQENRYGPLPVAAG